MTRIERIGMAAFALMMAISVSVIVMFPAGWWLQIHRLTVQDSTAGLPIIVNYDRTIRREFEGVWRVEVWRSQRGAWVSHCTAHGGPIGYDPEAVLPDPVTLEWVAYTQPRCYQLPPGSYMLRVRIDINPDGLLKRYVAHETPPFVVR